MTRGQRVLYWLGFRRLKAFRRWVGGRWVLHCPYAGHYGRSCILRWEHDPIVSFEVVATELWSRYEFPRASITSTRLAGAAGGGHDDQAQEEARLRL